MPTIAKFGVFTVAALVGVYVYAALRGPQGIPALKEKWNEIREMQMSNAELAARVNAKAERIRQLEEGQKAMEPEIRRQLKLQRPGETTFIVPKEPSQDEPTAAPQPAVEPRAEPAPPVKSKPAPKAQPKKKRSPQGYAPGELPPAPALLMPVEPSAAPALISASPALPANQ
jgi:cell division protein FtsB